jgi:hypothetical protein
MGVLPTCSSKVPKRSFSCSTPQIPATSASASAKERSPLQRLSRSILEAFDQVVSRRSPAATGICRMLRQAVRQSVLEPTLTRQADLHVPDNLTN